MNSVSTTNISGTDHDFDRPSGTGALCIATQALRAWLLSACPSGTKAIRPADDICACTSESLRLNDATLHTKTLEKLAPVRFLRGVAQMAFHAAASLRPIQIDVSPSLLLPPRVSRDHGSM